MISAYQGRQDSQNKPFSVANKLKVLLLLSGGKDSPEALRRLLNHGYDVHALCIDGLQGKEKVGALKAAQEFGIPIDVVQIAWFNENTWNPFLLIKRDIAMAVTALRLAKKINAQFVATGVKRSDVMKPVLWWLFPFLLLCNLIVRICGFKLLSPVWDWVPQTPSSSPEKYLNPGEKQSNIKKIAEWFRSRTRGSWESGIAVFEDNIHSQNFSTTHMVDDKRSSERVNFSSPVLYRMLSEKTWHHSQVVDISDTGLRLLSKNEMAKGQEVEMRIKLPRAEKTVKILGQIVWIRTKKMMNGIDLFEVGASFKNLDQISGREKMFGFIADRLAAQAMRASSEFKPRAAENLQEVEAACRLLYREYLKRGYCEESSVGMHYNHFMLLPHSKIFVLASDKQLGGTISLIQDSPCGLPMECIFSKEVQSARKSGVFLGEIGLLSIDGNLFGRNKFAMVNFKKYKALFELFFALLNHASEHSPITDFVIAVHPKHREMYEYLQFKSLSQVKTYADNQPAIAMQQDRKNFLKSIKNKRVGEFVQNVSVRQKLYDKGHEWNVNTVRDFLMERKNLWDEIPEKSREYLRAQYPGITLQASAA